MRKLNMEKILDRSNSAKYVLIYIFYFSTNANAELISSKEMFEYYENKCLNISSTKCGKQKPRKIPFTSIFPISQNCIFGEIKF